MAIGKGVVLIGMGERTTRQAVLQVAQELFNQKAVARVVGCLMPKSRARLPRPNCTSLNIRLDECGRRKPAQEAAEVLLKARRCEQEDHSQHP